MATNKAINKIAIDIDAYIYAAAFAAQKGLKDPEEIAQVPKSHAISILIGMLNSQLEFIFRSLGLNPTLKNETPTWLFDLTRKWADAGNLLFPLSPTNKSNFRYDVCSNYKAKRDPKNKPYHYDTLREYIIKKYNPIITEGQEPDDWLSVFLSEDPEHRLVNHLDKDIDQREGWHCWFEANNWCNRLMYYVEQPGFILLQRSRSGQYKIWATGDYMLAYQLLAGDTADNIEKPRKGMGDLEIYKYIQGYTELDNKDISIIDFIKVIYKEENKLELFERNLKLLTLLKEPLNGQAEKTKQSS